MTNGLLPLLLQEAQAAGFPIAGAVDLDLAFQDPEARFALHLERYDRWLEAGYAGKMDYLARGRDRRSNPRLVFPDAQSILCVALPYPARSAGNPEPSLGPRYARYMQGPDYHLEIAQRLETLMTSVQSLWEGPTLTWKVCVDTSAILERSWAYLAGLGWIGKNTLLIHPQLGSYFFLAEVLINQTTGQGPKPLPNFCGNCTRCLKSCPTQALRAPGTLDSTQCISYWTLEKRGDLEISSEQKQKIKNWIAGCDICQEVCPFNIKPSRAALPQNSTPHPPADDATLLHHWIELLRESPEHYRARIKRSALSRVKPAQFSRNLAISLSNSLRDLRAIPKEILNSLIPLIQYRREQETEPVAKHEWEECLVIVNRAQQDSF